MEIMLKVILVLFLVFALSGCSVSTLRCGVDEDRSYVELVNVPQDIAGTSRHFETLCGFAYEVNIPRGM